MTNMLENLQKITESLQSVHPDDLEKFEALDLGIEWLSILAAGISVREIIALQNVMGNATLKQLGKQIGVTPERVRMSREKALRRLRHPARERLAKIMPAKLHLAVYGHLA